MERSVEAAARAAAIRLSEQYGADVPTDVDVELGRDPDAPPDQYVDPVSIGALIVSIASLAWTVYQDLRRQNKPEPTTEVVSRTVRLQLDHPSHSSPDERAHVIDVTVEELLRQARPAN